MKVNSEKITNFFVFMFFVVTTYVNAQEPTIPTDFRIAQDPLGQLISQDNVVLNLGASTSSKPIIYVFEAVDYENPPNVLLSREVPDKPVGLTSTVISGLQRNTNYRFRLKAKNEDGSSDYSTDFASFTTLDYPYCAPPRNLTSVKDYIPYIKVNRSERYVCNAPKLGLNYEAYHLFPGNGDVFKIYTDNFHNYIALGEGNSYDFYASVWIDFNNNGSFESSEKIKDFSNFFTPSNAVKGITRMRIIRHDYSAPPANSCPISNNNQKFQIKDFYVSIESTKLIPKTPEYFSVSNITPNSVALKWYQFYSSPSQASDIVNGYMNCASFEVYNGDSLFKTLKAPEFNAVNNLNVVVHDENVLDGLAPNTTYNLRIKAKDALGNTSGFSKKVTVTTLKKEN